MGTPDHRQARVLYRDTLALTMVAVDNFAAVFNHATTMLCLTKIPDRKFRPYTVLSSIVRDPNAKVTAREEKGVTVEIYSEFAEDRPGHLQMS